MPSGVSRAAATLPMDFGSTGLAATLLRHWGHPCLQGPPTPQHERFYTLSSDHPSKVC